MSPPKQPFVPCNNKLTPLKFFGLALAYSLVIMNCHIPYFII